MTRDEIRAEAADRIAAAERSRRASKGLDTRPATDAVRDEYRAHAARIVAALDDLLPTGEEWGVRAGSDVRAVSESGVLHLRVAGAEPTICKRYVHEWRDAS